MWYIGANGEAYEVLSWSQGVVKILKFIPSPLPELKFRQDPFAHKRPLIALCDNSGAGPQYCSVSFISLTCGDVVFKFKSINILSLYLLIIKLMIFLLGKNH